ncbi:AAA family ATPase [Paenibacillus hexagrammi]|uniref:AAA family ATPase n=1 Tax=Paenibacillus hexagrammi TaxID=2908839 RepID=UPI002882FB94|nr:AAA family ATPase [Paenibacillus sp. YPD9-1]
MREIQEDVVTLRHYMQDQLQPMDIDVFLLIARSIAVQVEQLHRQLLLHLDLRPERIGLRLEEKEAFLMDDGYALPFSPNGQKLPYFRARLDEGMAYCAPESSGRMHRTVDERSDLYSLGILFFEMLAGHLPFEANHPLEWVYLHLTQSPPLISRGEFHQPDAIQAIVQTLLHKDPDKRYQRAAQVISDLEKAGDSSSGYDLELYTEGREQEALVLSEAFVSSCLGGTEIVYVSGEAGIGKTTLIHEVFRKKLEKRSFNYLTGKFEQFSQESPLAPIIQAFRGLIRHLLGGRKEDTDRWRKKLIAALGVNAGVITEIIPEVSHLLGDVAVVESLMAQESKKRFIYVFCQFVQALVSKDHPLVLVMDDLQWANASSLELLRALVCDPQSQYLLLVCAHRPLEADFKSGMLPGVRHDGGADEQASVHRIHLSPLELDQTNSMLASALHTSGKSVMPLAEVLQHLSRGNPFHLKQIIDRLQAERLLFYSAEQKRWKWDLGRIMDRESIFVLQDLVRHKLNRLSELAQEMLWAASCMGSTFSSGLLLVCMHNTSEHEQLSAWDVMEAEGLIRTVHGGTKQFVHDQIQQLIYDSIPAARKQLLHFQIGKQLTALQEEDLFERIHHLNLGAALIQEEAELLGLVRLNVEAGSRAKASSAYDAALGYLRRGAALLSSDNWERHHELLFELYIQKAESEYLCGNEQESEQDILLLLQKALDPVERSRVQMLRIMQAINQGRYIEGTAIGLESLRELKMEIPHNPGRFQLLLEGMRIEGMLRRRHEQFESLPDMSDPVRISAMNLIFAIVPSTFFTNKKVFFLIICRAVHLSLQYGNTMVSAAVYSAFGMLLGSLMGKFDKGLAIARIGVKLSERYQVASIQSYTYTMYGGVLCQFAGYAREGDEYLKRALKHGLSAGEYVFASYAMGAHVNSLYARASLDELARTIAGYMTVLDITKDEFVRMNFHLYQQYIAALQGGTVSADSFDSPGFDEEGFLSRARQEETSTTTLFQYYTYKAQMAFLCGHYEAASGWTHQAESYKAYATHLPHLPECLFYGSLASLAVHPVNVPLPKRCKSVLRYFRRLSLWSPQNFGARCLLLEAEAARALGKRTQAEELYDRAIREAREHEDLHAAALGAEFAFRYYKARGKNQTAQFYLHIALDHYRSWGLLAKVSQLEELLYDDASQHLPTVQKGTATTLEQTHNRAAHILNEPGTDTADLTAILQTAQAIHDRKDMKAALAEILQTILRDAGAGKGALLTSQGDALYLQAYAETLGAELQLPQNLDGSGLLPEGMIRYVYRTRETVRYTAGEESWVIHNPYMAAHKPKSILCLPIAVHDTMLGVLYLENRLAHVVFSEERTMVLQAMATLGVFICVLQGTAEPPIQEEAPTPEGHSSAAVLEEPLTDRELEVLALLAAGMSNKEIADRLVIALGTVKVHVKNIFAKLKVKRRTSAIAQAKELNLLHSGRAAKR